MYIRHLLPTRANWLQLSARRYRVVSSLMVVLLFRGSEIYCHPRQRLWPEKRSHQVIPYCSKLHPRSLMSHKLDQNHKNSGVEQYSQTRLKLPEMGH